MRKQESLARKANKTAYGYSHRHTGDKYSKTRNNKAMKEFHDSEQYFLPIKSKNCFNSDTVRIDPTPLIRFIHKNVGRNATEVYREARARFWTNKNRKETNHTFKEQWEKFTSGKIKIRSVDESFWSGTYVDENNLLQFTKTNLSVSVKYDGVWTRSIALFDEDGNFVDRLGDYYNSETVCFNGKAIPYPKKTNTPKEKKFPLKRKNKDKNETRK